MSNQSLESSDVAFVKRDNVRNQYFGENKCMINNRKMNKLRNEMIWG